MSRMKNKISKTNSEAQERKRSSIEARAWQVGDWGADEGEQGSRYLNQDYGDWGKVGSEVDMQWDNVWDGGLETGGVFDR